MGLSDFLRRKKPAAGPDAKQGGSQAECPPQICFVLCPNAEPGDLSGAAEAVAEVFGEGYSVQVSKDNILTVTHGDDPVGFLAYMPAPVPKREAELNAEHNFLWPKGKDEAAKHCSHVVVTNLGAKGLTPVQSALSVSRLALVALRLFDGIGVYWGGASVTNSREVFEGFCADISEKHLPVPVWLRYQLVRASPDELGLYTLGMAQFGLMDLEVDRSDMGVEELFELVSNIAQYLIQSGPVVADGHTIGSSADERILVRHRPSMVAKDRRVYKLVVGGK